MPSRKKRRIKEMKDVLRPEYRKALEESMKEYDDLLRALAKL